MKAYYLHLYLLSLFVFAAAFFCYGFFPLSYSSDVKSSPADFPQAIDDVQLNHTNYKSSTSKLILMIVDALRLDFVSRDDFFYLNTLLKNKNACLTKIKVHPPTVTMPRIKSLTSGTIPSFLDVVLNLGNVEMKIDNVLYQLHHRNDNIIFYGDDTWTKLFRNIFHRKGENRDSLFVNDFYEGDKNITQNVYKELKESDWKMMILHYLGLDHIGHVEGPFSNKVPNKLTELDEVVKNIHTHLKAWKLKLPPLFIITTDHGMRDSGGHGGSTLPEIIVPFIFSGHNCSESTTIYDQTDIATTLSVLLGLPIPNSSIGTVIVDFLIDFEAEHKLYALYYNAIHLLSKIKNVYAASVWQNKEFYMQFEEAKVLHKNILVGNKDNKYAYKAVELKYMAVNKGMQSFLLQNYIKFDLQSIILGLSVVMLINITVIVLAFVNSNENISIYFNIAKITIGYVLVVCVKHIFSYLFNINYISFLYDMMFAFIVISAIVVFECAQKLIKLITIPKISSVPISVHLIIFAIILHSVSLASSSFVEEEHQVWYYFCNTLFIILFIQDIRNNIEGKQLHCLVKWCLVFAFHIFSRRLNQTGDKWLHLPDIGDFLIKEENKMYLSWFALCGLCLVYCAIVNFSGFLTNILIVITLILIYYYRAINGSVIFFGVQQSKSRACLIIFWLGLIEIICINYAPFIYKKFKTANYSMVDVKKLLNSNIILFTLISSLIHKPHNIILNGGCILTSTFINDVIDRRPASKYNGFVKIVTHIWIGKIFYFYQGNSNSLASIDLNAGYVGLERFNIYFVGLFLTINTFSGQILAYLLLLRNIMHQTDIKSSIHQMQTTSRTITSFIILPLSFYLVIVTFFRNHIFIWTVFSPKIIYEIYFMFVFYFIILFTNSMKVFLVGKFEI